MFVLIRRFDGVTGALAGVLVDRLLERLHNPALSRRADVRRPWSRASPQPLVERQIAAVEFDVGERHFRLVAEPWRHPVSTRVIWPRAKNGIRSIRWIEFAYMNFSTTCGG